MAAVRVAVEGCGHGTLHDIYDSLATSCAQKGWDNADILIIGGDFQAVRNKHDLNVTAMPAKYRRMADFHEYYSGQRVAPCLTVFIGGNHEASNHLFELYYGGWVAPNIYYLGAANILRFGPLRIAGLSGIWKGYDYRKPHFERLPYNDSDTHSIFHVREIDVRKILSVRSQVDIGLSHDWPRGVEWKGDYQWLFRKKDMFEEDARRGQLGNQAAQYCLEHLRPAYWFSAHLHIKYEAVVEHSPPQGRGPTNNLKGKAEAVESSGMFMDLTNCALPQEQNQNDSRASQSSSGMLADLTNRPAEPAPSRHKSRTFLSTNGMQRQIRDRPQLLAWQGFHAQSEREDREDRQRMLQEQKEQEEEEARTGVRSGPKYTFDETFKQVSAPNGLDRSLVSITNTTQIPVQHTGMNLDGAVASALSSHLVSPLKRRRSPNSPTRHGSEKLIATGNGISQPASSKMNVDGSASDLGTAMSSSEKNVDAIDVDLSDSDEGPGDISLPVEATVIKESLTKRNISAPVYSSANDEWESAQTFLPANENPATEEIEGVEIGDVALNPEANSFKPSRESPPICPTDNRKPASDATPFSTTNDSQTPADDLLVVNDVDAQVGRECADAANLSDNKVSLEMRQKLAAEIPAFAPPQSLPFSEAITNKTTQFLALDKCEPHRQFLELLEITPISVQSENDIERPFKFEYDPEWLAILRAFASELELGGDSNSPIPPNRGEAYYQDRIMEERKWISENVVQKDLLTVPENFTITAPVYDPNLAVAENEMPCEYTNPQTSAFCKLIEIDNPFDISEEERDARITNGPRLEESGGYRGRGRGRGWGRGGRFGGRGDSRGRGRGSNRGRGRGRRGN